MPRRWPVTPDWGCGLMGTSPMRVLVTGAAGFVGQHVVAHLAAQGHHVVAATRTGVEEITGAEQVVGVGTIDANTDWRPVLTACEAVVHLAARAHRGEATTPAAVQAFHATNVAGSSCLAEAALAAGIRRMVFLSSCKVYGEQALRDAGGNPLPFDRHSPLLPTGPYGATKLAAEMQLTTLYEKANAALTILRPPLIYGPGNKANLLALMRAIARAWPLPLGAIANRRSLLFVGNLADAIGLALLRDAAGVRAYPLSDIELSTPDLVRALAAGMGRRARLLPVPTPCLNLAGRALGKASAVARLTDSLLVGSAELRAELGWQPQTSLTAAMRLTGEWFWRQS